MASRQAAVKAALPELPWVKTERLARVYDLPRADARTLAEDPAVADYFEACAARLRKAPAKMAANWLTGEVFAWMNQAGVELSGLKAPPQGLAELLDLAAGGTINLNTAKTVLGEMLASGGSAAEIVRRRGLEQVSDSGLLSALVRQVIEANPDELAKFKAGKETLANWFYGQVMREAKGKANPAVVKEELERQLKSI
jgi:aspartyl-tRNA(Asn)/glutamyl-tRNA(Gln) amidotransferase subunit B